MSARLGTVAVDEGIGKSCRRGDVAVYGLWALRCVASQSATPRGQAWMVVDRYVVSLWMKTLQRFGLADAGAVTAIVATRREVAVGLEYLA
eukprot:4733537-Pyramimonas_sp.AAC.1